MLICDNPSICLLLRFVRLVQQSALDVSVFSYLLACLTHKAVTMENGNSG